MYGILRVSTFPSGNIITFVRLCHKTALYSNKYVINFFNVHASFSIDTKLHKCKVHAYDINYIYIACVLAGVGCADKIIMRKRRNNTLNLKISRQWSKRWCIRFKFQPPYQKILIHQTPRILPMWSQQNEVSTIVRWKLYKIGGMCTLKHEIISPKFYEIFIKIELKGYSAL